MAGLERQSRERERKDQREEPVDQPSGPGLEVLLDAVNAIDQTIPAAIRRADWSPLAQHPPGNGVSLPGASVHRGHLYPNETVEQVPSLPGPEPQSPG